LNAQFPDWRHIREIAGAVLVEAPGGVDDPGLALGIEIAALRPCLECRIAENGAPACAEVANASTAAPVAIRKAPVEERFTG
jgi:hypothetical protein